jgi:hypothetical protein
VERTVASSMGQTLYNWRLNRSAFTAVKLGFFVGCTKKGCAFIVHIIGYFVPRLLKYYEYHIHTFKTPYIFQQINEQHVARSFTKLAVPQLEMAYPPFYVSRVFISVFTRARHLSIISHINPVYTLPILVFRDPF